MKIAKLNYKIAELLADFEVKDLPTLPNLNGVFESTDISFAIISGQISSNIDYVNVKINVSVAATLRTSTETLEDEKNLYGLVEGVVYKLQKCKIEAGGLIRLSGFEMFTPESGKWRCLLTFGVDITIDSEKDLQC